MLCVLRACVSRPPAQRKSSYGFYLPDVVCRRVHGADGTRAASRRQARAARAGHAGELFSSFPLFSTPPSPPHLITPHQAPSKNITCFPGCHFPPFSCFFLSAGVRSHRRRGEGGTPMARGHHEKGPCVRCARIGCPRIEPAPVSGVSVLRDQMRCQHQQRRRQRASVPNRVASSVFPSFSLDFRHVFSPFVPPFSPDSGEEDTHACGAHTFVIRQMVPF